MRTSTTSPARTSTPCFARPRPARSSAVMLRPSVTWVVVAEVGDHVEQHGAGGEAADLVDAEALGAAEGVHLVVADAVVVLVVAVDVHERVHVRGGVRRHHQHVLVGAGAVLAAVHRVDAVVGGVLQGEPHRGAAVVHERHALALDRDAEAVHLAGGDRGGGRLDDLGRELVERAALVVVAPAAPVVGAAVCEVGHVGPPGRSSAPRARVRPHRSGAGAGVLEAVAGGPAGDQASAGRISLRSRSIWAQPISIGMPPQSGCMLNMAKSPAALASSTTSAGETTR